MEGVEADHKLTLELSFKRDSSGTWNIDIQRPSTTFANLMESLFTSGTEAVNFEGKVHEPPSEEKVVLEDKLQFHVKGGHHTAISGNGRTAFAFGNDPFKTWAMTKRTLQLNELFEVELTSDVVKCEVVQRPSSCNSYGQRQATPLPLFCIGVTPMNPASFEENIDKRPNGWYWTGMQIYTNEVCGKNVGKIYPKVGDRVGILQDSSGKLHFFINGLDQGEYSEKLPFPLFGCIQFGKELRAATILEPEATYGYLLKMKAEK